MAKDTKERILGAALEMFSQNGYAGTNIRELTASLGLGKSSMYRHFASKEEIWNTLLDDMTAYYAARFGSPEHLPPVPDSPEELAAMTMRLVELTVRDEKIVMIRKLLMIEQFRDDRARFCGHDGQKAAAPGRPGHARLCLHRADHRADPPVRPRAGKGGRGDPAGGDVHPAFH